MSGFDYQLRLRDGHVLATEHIEGNGNARIDRFEEAAEMMGRLNTLARDGMMSRNDLSIFIRPRPNGPWVRTLTSYVSQIRVTLARQASDMAGENKIYQGERVFVDSYSASDEVEILRANGNRETVFAGDLRAAPRIEAAQNNRTEIIRLGQSYRVYLPALSAIHPEHMILVTITTADIRQTEDGHFLPTLTQTIDETHSSTLSVTDRIRRAAGQNLRVNHIFTRAGITYAHCSREGLSSITLNINLLTQAHA